MKNQKDQQIVSSLIIFALVIYIIKYVFIYSYLSFHSVSRTNGASFVTLFFNVFCLTGYPVCKFETNFN